MTEQRDPRQTFTSEGVRGDAVYALREMLAFKGIDEGEFLSKLFEKAVLEEHGGAGPARMLTYKREYQEQLDLKP